MAKNLLVCANSLSALKKINESENPQNGYFLEGVFAELDTLNRNKRIYPKDEYLKHLSYLRDDIKKGEPLLGELDHPEDRFEVKLKEASHRIVDLWYDAKTNCVMGKIELLNTPNGKLAQSLVDQGIPLHISSRAAGTVGNDSKVSVQQIYTYDIVCKPGFAGAVLHRVNESEGTKYDSETNKFLEESNRAESLNAAPQFGFVNEEFSIREVPFAPKGVRKMSEGWSDDAKSYYDAPDSACPDKSNSLKENTNDNNMEINKTTEEGLDEKKKVAPTAEVKMKSVFEEGEDSEEKDEKGETTDQDADNSEEEKKEDKEDGVEILSVKAVTDDEEDEDGVDIKDVKADDEDSDEDKSDDEKSDDEEPKEEDKKDECDGGEQSGSKNDSKTNTDDDKIPGGEDSGKKEDCDGKKCDPKKDALFDCDEIKSRREKFEDKFAEFVDSHKRKEEDSKKNESLIINKYPTFSMFSKQSLNEVMKLDESQKSKVAAYLSDNNFCTPELMNENWKNGVDYEPETEVWLKYAPSTYKALFEKASETVKESIRNTASYLLFENQYDVNHFWENTGLMESEERRIAEEKFINNMPKLNESKNDDNNGLPYSKEFIQMITDVACEYNN